MLGQMGKKHASAGYWHAGEGKLELLQRHPDAPVPETSVGWRWITLWVLIAALGAAVVWIGLNAWSAGEPVAGRFGRQVPAWFAVLVGLFLLVFPMIHLPQVRKDNARLTPRITATPYGLDVLGKTEEYGRYLLPWENIRGFRVEKGKGWQRRQEQLTVDLAGTSRGPGPDAGSMQAGGRPAWNPLVSVTTNAARVSDIFCFEPHATAYALNHFLGDAALRSAPGSPHSEATANAALASGANRRKARTG